MSTENEIRPLALFDAFLSYAKHQDKIKNKNVLVIIDMSLPSYKKRLYVIDTKTLQVLRHHHVAHGSKSSDPNDLSMAINFSNKIGSKMSSLGPMVTAETYFGLHGLSLKLDGLDSELNSNVRKRYVVIHSARYATDNYIKKHGRLGQSSGCPAVDPAISKSLINMIKDGVFLYIAK